MTNTKTALLSAKQMGEADRLTVASGIDSITLMENAGRPVAFEITKRWTPCPVVVFAAREATAVMASWPRGGSRRRAGRFAWHYSCRAKAFVAQRLIMPHCGVGRWKR
jgi:hypothetical protein